MAGQALLAPRRLALCRAWPASTTFHASNGIRLPLMASACRWAVVSYRLMHSKGTQGGGGATEKIGTRTPVQLDRRERRRSRCSGNPRSNGARLAAGHSVALAQRQGGGHTHEREETVLTAGAHGAGRGERRGSATRVWSKNMGRVCLAQSWALRRKGARRVGESGGVGHGFSARVCKSLL